MKVVRAALTLCALGVFAAFVNRTVIAPWNINEAKKSIERTTVALIRSGDPLGAISVIQRNLERLDSSLSLTPFDVELYMLRAANLRLVNRTADAIATYRAALEYDRRPEIYFNLGLVQIDAGSRTEGIDNLAMAVRFRSDYLTLIPDPSVRDAVAHKTGPSI